MTVIHNTDYDYWILGLFNYKINIPESVKHDKIIDKCYHKILGFYTIRNENDRFYATKKYDPENINFDRFFNGEFDSFNARKKAYGLTRDKILNMFRKTKTTPIKGEGIVKIYKKHKNKK